MSFKTPLLCDRRIYNHKGKWKSPNNDIEENVFYFIKEPLSLASSYIGGREELKETLTIVVFGSKPITQYDEITLDSGKKYTVSSIVYNEQEINILVKDMLKPRYGSMEIILE